MLQGSIARGQKHVNKCHPPTIHATKGKRQNMPLVIDCHHHLLDEPNYVERLLETCHRLGIAKVCLSALGEQFGMPDNDAVEQAVARYPEHLIGFYYLRLDEEGPEVIATLRDRGFSGLKTTCPRRNYDDETYYLLYEAAQAHRFPFLFHTGVVVRGPKDHLFRVNSARMRPIFLDAVARAFPDLSLIVAHLGVPWHEEAATLARFHPNLHVDLTGAPEGWRRGKPLSFYSEIFWWPGAARKILFGSDVHYTQMEAVLADYQRIVDALNADPATREAIFGGTMAQLLGWPC